MHNITLSEIIEHRICRIVEESMVANVLGRLSREGKIEKVGSGPATRYRRARNRP